jgi:hypothetical protein
MEAERTGDGKKIGTERMWNRENWRERKLGTERTGN